MFLHSYIIHPIEAFYGNIYLCLAGWSGNYGVAVIALSLFNFALLYPFTRKAHQVQQEELHLQMILQEQIKDIKDKYSGKEQFETIQRLYDRYSYHPIMAVRSVLGLLFQLPFLLAVFYMLASCEEIQGVSWGVISNLGKPDQLLAGINLLPFVMALVTILYAFVMPEISKKERLQTVVIGVFFLVLLYSAPSALLIFWTCNLIWSLLDKLLSKKLSWLGDYISENELALHIIFALSLTVGLLIPLEIYIKNANELWFGIKDVLKFLIENSAKYFCVFFLIYIALIIVRYKKVKFIYLSILIGALLGVFLQSYIISLDYGLFDGHEIEWGKYTVIGFCNTFIWFACLFGPFCFFRRLKFEKGIIKRIVKPITFGIVVVQCVVLSFTIIKNPLPENALWGRDSINVLTTKDMFNISSKDNIIVFLLDAFDARIFEEIMEKDPEIIKGLNGFTFYPDTTSVYGYSDYSVPQILTGKVYHNDIPYVEYIKKAWQNNLYFKQLLKNNYNVGVFTFGSYVSKDAPIFNLTSEKTVLNDEAMKDFNRLVLFRMSPHYAKNNFYNYDPNARLRLIKNRKIEAYKEDDRKFFLSLKKGLMTQNNQNCFRFYHLNGAHYPIILDRNLEFVNKYVKGSQYEQSVGVMKIVLEYIEQMKKQGLFENSTFVIMADHGEHNKIGSRPLFCFKKRNVSNTDLVVSKDSISFLDFSLMLFEEFNHRSYYIKNENRQRVFYYTTARNEFIEYQIVGDAKNVSSWIKGNKLENWKYHNMDNSYCLGDVIDFTHNGDSQRYKLNGWSKEEIYGSWFIGENADLLLNIKDYKHQNLKISFATSVYLTNRSVRTIKVYANEQLVSSFDTGSETTYMHSLKIPATIVNNNLLNIRFNINNSEEPENLGLYMHYLKVEKDE